jgi:hypothetical protein
MMVDHVIVIADAITTSTTMIVDADETANPNHPVAVDATDQDHESKPETTAHH